MDMHHAEARASLGLPPTPLVDLPPPCGPGRLTGWTEEQVEVLKKLWGKGFSASRIANELGEVSRNAVIGKVHRLGLAGRVTTSRSAGSRLQARIARERKPVKRAPRPMPDFPVEPLPETPAHSISLGLSFNELTAFSCRWIDGDPRSASYCGHERMPGSSYCPHHHKRSVPPAQPAQPVQPRRHRRRRPSADDRHLSGLNRFLARASP